MPGRTKHKLADTDRVHRAIKALHIERVAHFLSVKDVSRLRIQQAEFSHSFRVISVGAVVLT